MILSQKRKQNIKKRKDRKNDSKGVFINLFRAKIMGTDFVGIVNFSGLWQRDGRHYFAVMVCTKKRVFSIVGDPYYIVIFKP